MTVVPSTEPSDETLASRAAAGDDHAFETIVRRYQARVYRLAGRLTSETDAPDVLQDTFLQVHRHLPSFRGDSRFSTWLYRIATNAGLMHRRARARRPAEPLDAFLPTFDAAGSHCGTPEQLRVVWPGFRIFIARRSSCATSKKCRPPRWLMCSASSLQPCGSACTARACCSGATYRTSLEAGHE